MGLGVHYFQTHPNGMGWDDDDLCHDVFHDDDVFMFMMMFFMFMMMFFMFMMMFFMFMMMFLMMMMMMMMMMTKDMERFP